MGVHAVYNSGSILSEFDKFLEHHHERGCIIENKPHVVNGQIEYSEVLKPRAMTFESLYNFLGIGATTFKRYQVSKDEAMVNATEYMRNYIFAHNFEYAAANQTNSTLMARYLGIVDKQQLEVTEKIIDSGEDEW
jgi:hypothetical protein